MFMYLRKNKKGFTLIELMVVVAIIGILALLGLRVYSGQQDRAKIAIVKGNAGTIQTLIQSELADKAPGDFDVDTDIIAKSGIVNPFTNTKQTESEKAKGSVIVDYDNDTEIFSINGYGNGTDDTDKVYDDDLTARR